LEIYITLQPVYTMLHSFNHPSCLNGNRRSIHSWCGSSIVRGIYDSRNFLPIASPRELVENTPLLTLNLPTLDAYSPYFVHTLCSTFVAAHAEIILYIDIRKSQFHCYSVTCRFVCFGLFLSRIVPSVR
jgi:hypothetical protein